MFSDENYTLCSEKNAHSRFLLYLHGKCLDLHKIFRECLVGNTYSTSGKVRHSLLLVTSCWRHISVFANYRFCHWWRIFDEMLKHINWSLC